MVTKPENPEEIVKTGTSSVSADDIFHTQNREKRETYQQTYGDIGSLNKELHGGRHDPNSAQARKKEEERRFMQRVIIQQSIQNQLLSLNNDLDELSEKLNKKFLSRDNSLGELKKIREHIHTLKTERETIDLQIEREEENLENIDHGLEIHKEHEENKAELREAEERVQQAQQKNASPDNIKNLEEHREHCKGKCCISEEKLEDLPSKEELEEQKENSEQKLADLREKKENINTQLKEALKEHEDCFKKLKTIETEIEELKEELDQKNKLFEEHGVEMPEEERIQAQEKLDALKQQINEHEEKYKTDLDAIENDEHAQEITKLKTELAETETTIETETLNLASINESLSTYFNSVCKVGTDYLKDIGKTALNAVTEQIGLPSLEFDSGYAALEAKIMAQVESGNISADLVDELTEGASPEFKDKIIAKLEERGIEMTEKPEIFGGAGTKQKIAELNPDTPHAEHVTISAQEKTQPSEYQNEFAAAATNIARETIAPDIKPSAQFTLSA